MNDFSTTETRTIFDTTKIGVGDVVEFQSIESVFSPYEIEGRKVASLSVGIVEKVDSNDIVLVTGERKEAYGVYEFVRKVLTASDNLDMRIVYRNPKNISDF